MPISFSRRLIALVFAATLALFPLAAGDGGLKLNRVVIDAGHGGHDPGCISPDGKVKEKTIALDIALLLGERISKAFPDVEVSYTRDKDIFIPLYTRADIANSRHADLFISIHCNAVSSKKPSGFETFVMGMNSNAANMEVCKRENAVILLEDDYTTRYAGFDPNDTESYIMFNLMQNAYFEQSLILADLCQKALAKGPVVNNRGIKQGGLVVLWRSTMPSVLVEVGFLSNSEDRAVLTSKAKREQIADALASAFAKFKEQYEAGADDLPENTTAAEEPSGTFFAVQLFALSKLLESGSAQFKGEKDIHRFNAGNVYKYTAGEYKTEAEATAAAKRLADKFPGCFVVKIENFEITKK